MFIHILTGIFGQKMWSAKPSKYISKSVMKYLGSKSMLYKVLNLKLGTALVYVGAFAVAIMTIYMIVSTLAKNKNKFTAIAQYFSSILIVLM